MGFTTVTDPGTGEVIEVDLRRWPREPKKVPSTASPARELRARLRLAACPLPRQPGSHQYRRTRTIPYRQIADQLRATIWGVGLQPGDRPHSKTALMDYPTTAG